MIEGRQSTAWCPRSWLAMIFACRLLASPTPEMDDALHALADTEAGMQFKAAASDQEPEPRG